MEASAQPSGISLVGSRLRVFVHECVRRTPGSSLRASELRAAYEVWCKENGCEPLSIQKFGIELRSLGFGKWKSSGLIRYRDLQLRA